MPVIQFTPNLARHLETPTASVAGTTVAEALSAVFAANARLRGYILDDQGRVRRHVNVFVDGERIADRDNLTDPVTDEAEIYVMQALSGG